MRVYLEVDADCRVTGYGSAPLSPGNVEMDIPENHDFYNNPPAYQVVNGELVFVEAYAEQLIAQRIQAEKIPSETEQLQAQLQASNDYMDFLEECLAEMAQVVYG